MAQTMHKLLVGEALSTASRQQLRQWLLANTTGGKRLKAGVPASWQVGDKTGTNATDANDIGFLIPPQGAPWIVTAYLAGSSAEERSKMPVWRMWLHGWRSRWQRRAHEHHSCTAVM